MSLFGGALADRLDKNLILRYANLITGIALLALFALDITGMVAVWHVLLIAAIVATVQGLDWPTRQSFFPLLIERKDMMSAVALNSYVWQATRMILPAVGGLLIAWLDTWITFLIGALGAFTMVLVLGSLPHTKPSTTTQGSTVDQVLQGLSYIRSTPLFFTLIGLSFCSSFFVSSYAQLLPAFADLLGADEAGYGYLLSAGGLGSLVGTLLMSGYQHHPRLGRMLLACCFASGVALLAFCWIAAGWTGTTAYLAALTAAFVIAMLASGFLVSSMTAMQLRVPDDMRGRVMGIHTITYSLMPLGALLMGWLATDLGAPGAVAAGAVVFLVLTVYLGGKSQAVRNLGQL